MNPGSTRELNVDVVKRIKQGQCPRCGIQTHKLMLGGLKKVPLDNDKVAKGRCLSCNPFQSQNVIVPIVSSPMEDSEVPGQVPRFVNGERNSQGSVRSMRSEMSEITMHTFQTKQHSYQHHHQQQQQHSHVPVSSPAPTTAVNAASKSPTHLASSVQSFSQDSYWNVTPSNGSIDASGTKVDMLKEMDGLPGGDDNHDKSANKKTTLFKKVVSARRMHSFDPMKQGEIPGRQQSSLDQQRNRTDRNIDNNNGVSHQNKIRLEDTDGVLSSKPLPLFGATNSREHRNITPVSSLRQIQVNTPATAPHASSVSSRYARINENKIKLEEPIHGEDGAAIESPPKPLPLFGASNRREHRNVNPSSSLQHVSVADDSRPNASANRYNRINENKIKLEDPIRIDDTDDDNVAKPLPLFSSNKRHTNRDHNNSFGSVNNNINDVSVSAPSGKVNVKPVTLAKKDSDTEPPLEDPKIMNSNTQTTASRAPVMRRSVQAMAKEAVSRPRATVPGVVRENNAPRAAKQMNSISHNSNLSAAGNTFRSRRSVPVSSANVVGQSRESSGEENIPEHISLILKRMKTMTRIPEIVQAMLQHSDEPKIQEIGCMKFRNLSAHPSYVSGVKDVGGIEIIIRSMDTHINHIGVQEQGCAALWCLAAQSDENKEEIQAEGGITSILSAIKIHINEENLIVWACGALYSIAFNDSSKVLVGSSGGIEAIVQAMEIHSHHPGIQDHAILALDALCNGSQSNSIIVSSCRGIEAIMNALREHKCRRLRLSGCKLLAKMSTYPRITMNQYVSSEPDLFLDVLLACGTHLDVALSILSLLSSAMLDLRACATICKETRLVDLIADLILAYENNSFIHEKGMLIIRCAASSGDCTYFKGTSTIDAIKVVLESRSISTSLLLDVTNILLNWISFDSNVVRSFKKSEGLKMLLSLIRRPQSSQVQEKIISIIASLLSDSDRESVVDEFLNSSGSVKLLSKIMSDNQNDEYLQTRCCSILYVMSSMSKGRRIILEQGFLNYVLNFMRSFHAPLIQEFSCNIIWNLSIDLEDTVEAICESDGLSQLLTAATETNELRSNRSSFNQYSGIACSAIWNLSQNTVIRKQLDMLDAVDALLNIAAAFRNDKNTQEMAIGILSNMCKDKSSADKLRQVNGIRTIIRSANTHAYNKKIQEITCVALRNMALSSPNNLQAVCNDGGIDIVVGAILNNKDEDVRVEACACLRALSNTNLTDVKASIVKAGGIDALMEVMDDHPANELLQTEACATIPLLSGAADFQIVLVPRSAVGN